MWRWEGRCILLLRAVAVFVFLHRHRTQHDSGSAFSNRTLFIRSMHANRRGKIDRFLCGESISPLYEGAGVHAGTGEYL